jgi:catechol 2,3-dioxygenase-like lactoylglutathione lyase family enzyme
MNTPRSDFFALAIPVTDLELSTRFYRDALGFEVGATRSPNEGKSGFVGRFMSKGGLVIELLEFENTNRVWKKAFDPDEKMRINDSVEPCDQIGIVSHIVLDCKNSAVEEAVVVANGGSVAMRESVEMTGGMGTISFVFVRDPDGLWIELANFPNTKVRNEYAGLSG